ncbi:MAG: hypothetical protein VB876_04825, partial [Pirellulales bacterium]
MSSHCRSSHYGSRRLILAAVLCWGFAWQAIEVLGDTFRAGAAAVDVTPLQFPVVVNGMFQQRSATRAHDRLMS